MVVVAVLCLLFACATAQFKIESHFARLQQFGPLKSSGWDARPMRLVADFTLRIDGLDVGANMPFMFVSAIGPPYPVLGGNNWKSSKLGAGPGNTLLPGGGPGFYERDGNTSIIVRTGGHPTAPWTYELLVTGGRAHVSLATRPSAIVRVGETLDLVVTATGPAGALAVSDVAAKLKMLDEFGVLSSPLVAADAPPSCPATPASERVECNGDATSCASKGCCWSPLEPNSREPWCFRPPTRRFQAKITAKKEGTLWMWIEDGGSQFSGGATSVQVTQSINSGSKWGPLIDLRDQSGVFKHKDMPAEGWRVTPIHAVYLPTQASLLISGFLRRDGVPCLGGDESGPNGRRRSGITFRVKVADLMSSAGGSLAVQRVEEAGEIVFGETAGQMMEGETIDGDTIYCSGHTHLTDGKLLFVGGARYARISSPFEHEWGLDYARVYDPVTNEMTRVADKMPLGRSWYPTAGFLADGRVLVTGAFSDYATAACTADACLNPQINIFDPKKLEQKQNPWSVWLDKQHGDPDLNPGVREYTRVFVLPKLVQPKGAPRAYGILALGKAGRVVLISDDDSVRPSERLFKPANGKRPGKCGEASNQSSAAPLTIRGGVLMIVGGCNGDDETMQRIDLYDVETDSWSSLSTGVMRAVPATVLLPDGKVLILSGENEKINQIAFNSTHAPMDTRVPQLFDPVAMTVSSELGDGTQRDLFRGYHNFAALLPDGSLLIGGGFNQGGDVGCEEPNFRVFKPHYLSLGARPVFASSRQVVLVAGQKGVVVPYSGAGVRNVSLLRPSAFTHSYDQAQRHVFCDVVSVSADSVTIDIPEVPMLLPGYHHMFLISEAGVPSVSVVAFVKRFSTDADPPKGEEPNPESPAATSTSSSLASAMTTAIASFVAVIHSS